MLHWKTGCALISEMQRFVFEVRMWPVLHAPFLVSRDCNALWMNSDTYLRINIRNLWDMNDTGHPKWVHLIKNCITSLVIKTRKRFVMKYEYTRQVYSYISRSPYVPTTWRGKRPTYVRSSSRSFLTSLDLGSLLPWYCYGANRASHWLCYDKQCLWRIITGKSQGVLNPGIDWVI